MILMAQYSPHMLLGVYGKTNVSRLVEGLAAARHGDGPLELQAGLGGADMRAAFMTALAAAVAAVREKG